MHSYLEQQQCRTTEGIEDFLVLYFSMSNKKDLSCMDCIHLAGAYFFILTVSYACNEYKIASHT